MPSITQHIRFAIIALLISGTAHAQTAAPPIIPPTPTTPPLTTTAPAPVPVGPGVSSPFTPPAAPLPAVSPAGDNAAAAAPPPAAPPNVPLPEAGKYTIEGDANALNIFAVSMDAQELFTALAAKANLRLVVDDTVSRRLTLNITKTPARQAIDEIVSAYGLSAADVDGVTMISEGIPRSPSSYLLSDITSIPTKYVNAANARNLLPVFLQDYVKVNSEQNAVVLSAPTEVLTKFRQDIAQFDIPASQIQVDLLLVDLTDTNVDQLGLTLNYQNGGQGPSIDAGAGNIVYNAVTRLPNLFQVNLKALQEQGKARVRANPRIATVSGRRASIFVGQQRYVATPIDLGNGGGQRNFIDAGVRLGVTPYTGGQGQILVDVDAEVSTLSPPDAVTHLPEKSTRTASTVVRVLDGQTIVIGGLVQQERRDVRTKVPVLGDLPLVGPLFQTRSVNTTQSDLVLFITPRILSDTGHLPAAEEAKMKHDFLDSDLNKPLPALGTPTLAPPSPEAPVPGGGNRP